MSSWFLSRNWIAANDIVVYAKLPNAGHARNPKKSFRAEAQGHAEETKSFPHALCDLCEPCERQKMK